MDNQLSIDVIINASGAVEGAEQAKAIVDKTAASIKAAFGSVAAASDPVKQAFDMLSNAAKSTAPNMANVAEMAKAVDEALGQTAASAQRAAAGVGSLDRAMAQANVRILSSAAGLGGMGTALGRVAATSQTLAPLIAAAFPVIGAVAFAAIAVDLGKKIYDVYQNVFLLKSSIDALNVASARESRTAAELNEEFDLGMARLKEQNKQLAEADQWYRKAAAEKPLRLPEIPKDIYEQFNEAFASYVSGTHLAGEATQVLARIQAEAASTEAQLSVATKNLSGSQDEYNTAMRAGGQGGEAFGILVAHQAALVDDLTKKLDFLKGAMGELQSQTGINALNEKLRIGKVDTSGQKDALEAARKFAEQQKQAADQELRVMEDGLLAMRAAHAMSKEEEATYWRDMNAVSAAGSALFFDTARKANEIRGQINDEAVAKQKEDAEKMARGFRELGDDIARAFKEQLELKKQAVAEQQRLDDEQMNSALRAAKERFEMTSVGAGGGAAGVQQKLAALQQEAQQEVAIYDQRLAELDKFDKNYEAKEQELQARILQIWRDTQIKREEIDKQYEKELERSMQSVVGGPLEGMVRGMLTGQERIGVAFQRMGQEMLINLTMTLAEMEIKHLEHEAAVLIAHQVTNQLKVASDTQAAAESNSISALEAIKEVTHAAAAGAAKAYQAMAGIPIIGPELGVAAAAATFAGIELFGSLASAAGGFDVPEDMLAMIHKNEMVLPANIAENFRNVAPGGASSGDIHLHVNAADAKSVQRLFERNSGALVKTLRKAVARGIH